MSMEGVKSTLLETKGLLVEDGWSPKKSFDESV